MMKHEIYWRNNEFFILLHNLSNWKKVIFSWWDLLVVENWLIFSLLLHFVIIEWSIEIIKTHLLVEKIFFLFIKCYFQCKLAKKFKYKNFWFNYRMTTLVVVFFSTVIECTSIYFNRLEYVNLNKIHTVIY